MIGLDSVNAALEANRAMADAEGIKNLVFVSYDGTHISDSLTS